MLIYTHFSIPCFAAEYTLDGYTLEHVFEEKDLGVVVDSELTFMEHIETKVQKANSILGMIRRSFTFLDIVTMVTLFTAFVRPHLEYAHAVWSPSSLDLIKKIEKIQMRALDLVPELQSFDYPEQLRRAQLPTLSYRRLRGDMIDTFKHLLHVPKGYDTTVLSKSFTINQRCSRKHDYQLVRQHENTSPLSWSFYFRIREIWNNLDESVVNSLTVNDFKNNHLDAHWENLDIKFNHKAPPPTRISNKMIWFIDFGVFKKSLGKNI